MLVGYMRVSSESDRQTTNLQRDALMAVGVALHLTERLARLMAFRDEFAAEWLGSAV